MAFRKSQNIRRHAFLDTGTEYSAGFIWIRLFARWNNERK